MDFLNVYCLLLSPAVCGICISLLGGVLEVLLVPESKSNIMLCQARSINNS